MNSAWHIELFGGLQATQESHVVSRFRTQKTGALLGYLALHRERPTPRETLLEMLWPDDEMDDARNNLRVALASLRRQFEPPGEAGTVIIADRLTAALSSISCLTDVAEFESRLRQGDSDSLAEAVTLYRGELLAGFYDDWIFPERERLATAYLGALRLLRRQLAEAEEFDRAAHYAHLSVQADPLDEAAHRALMRLHAAMGRPDSVRAQFSQLEARLKEELDAAPSSKTVALLEELSAGRPVRVAAKISPAPPLAAPAPVVRTGSLPVQFTPFFGRVEERARLHGLLPEFRLLTLTGPGGTGKTRLAIEAAREAWETFDGRIWFAGLADLTDARRLLDVVAETLRLPRAPGTEPLAQITEFLDRRPALLLLDNFEQLTGEGGPMLAALRESLPMLTLLVTSRRCLGLPGEREIPLSPLPVPEEGDNPERLARTAAVQLFVDRAQAVRPDFQITPRNAADIAALCRQLDGLPLALELAAARARVLSPAQMRVHLADRFELLINRKAEKDARHRSLRAAIDWSLHLLHAPLRLAFARLSVFSGGWTLDAAAAVLGESSALDILEQLRAESLILTQDNGEFLRFRMLESLREFARERLSEEERNECTRRAVVYFLTCAQQAENELKGPKQARQLGELAAELENFRAAFDWTATHEPKLGVQLGSALWQFFYLTGRFAEGRERVTAALTASENIPEKARADALNGAGMLTWRMGDNDAARALLGEAQSVFSELNDKAGQAAVLNNRAALDWSQGRLDEARDGHEKSLRLKRELGDRWGIASSLNNLGAVARDAGDAGGARKAFEESLHLCEELGDLQGMATAHNNLGNIAFGASDFRLARERYEKSLTLKRELGNAFGCGVSLNNLGVVALHVGDLTAARACLEESLRLYRDAGARQGIAVSLTDLGRVAAAEGHLEDARGMLMESLDLRRSLGLRTALPTGLDAWAELAAATNLWPCAVRLFAAADHLRHELNLPPEAPAAVRQSHFLDAARAALSPEDFARHQKEGTSLSDDDAVSLTRFPL